MADAVQQATEGDFGQEVPEFVAAGGFLVFLIESAGKTNRLFELHDAGVWEVELGE